MKIFISPQFCRLECVYRMLNNLLEGPDKQWKIAWTRVNLRELYGNTFIVLFKAFVY